MLYKFYEERLRMGPLFFTAESPCGKAHSAGGQSQKRTTGLFSGSYPLEKSPVVNN